MTVQSAGGPEWPKRDVSPIRASVARVDLDDDKRTPVGRETAANPHNQVIDAVRTAALRRDAALVRTSDAAKANTPTDDSAIADEDKPSPE